MKYASSYEVSRSFGKYQDDALAQESVTVTRYGRPTVVIMSYVEYERIAGSQAKRRRVARRAEDMPDELLAKLDEVIDDTKRRMDASELADVTA